ncbi:hypothetical protein F5148DRAFT_109022 [Russula earlei]|uniref:Uncharacterized protein n=1 Tax=Russula earlei TaxID=71964 RepID=A0ACC0U7K5_9AGAM|nr:hypothetical protein F5148DRAFT_109022 [Russula earlei]
MEFLGAPFTSILRERFGGVHGRNFQKAQDWPAEPCDPVLPSPMEHFGYSWYPSDTVRDLVIRGPNFLALVVLHRPPQPGCARQLPPPSTGWTKACSRQTSSSRVTWQPGNLALQRLPNSFIHSRRRPRCVYCPPALTRGAGRSKFDFPTAVVWDAVHILAWVEFGTNATHQRGTHLLPVPTHRMLEDASRSGITPARHHHLELHVALFPW